MDFIRNKDNTGKKYEYDFLEFIDSPDIKKYNSNTEFHPAEQAVLIARSKKRTVEEKIRALRYLAESYSEEEFQRGSVKIGKYSEQEQGKFRDCILDTVELWEQLLKDRYNAAGYVYASYLNEKDFIFIRDDLAEYHFFSNYKSAYEDLCMKKKEYLENKDLAGIQTAGKICRLKLDDMEGCYTPYDVYRFDNELRLIDTWRCSPQPLYKTIDEYTVFVPLPFAPGDIVKVSSPFYPAYYGVIPRKWERRETGFQSMEMSVDVYDEKCNEFDFTDDTDILDLEYCPDEELPEGQKILECIRDARTGKIDFFTLLYYYGKGKVGELLK